MIFEMGANLDEEIHDTSKNDKKNKSKSNEILP